MLSELSGTVGRLRRPEYTGENRCIPCTTVNVAIAVVLAVGAGVVNPILGVVVFGISLLSIYLRGYLVPGTPTLTKRYFPDWLLAMFEKEPATPGTSVGADLEAETEPDAEARDETGPERGPETVDPETVLVEHELVEPCEDVEDLCLADGVGDRWRARIEELRDGDRPAQVADFLERDSDAVEVETDPHGEAVAVRIDGRIGARWESDAALLADVAATDVLADRVPGWEDLPLEARSQLASGLRAFVEVCPACDGSISIDEDTVESCCRSHEVYAVTCEDCEARILEVQQ